MDLNESQASRIQVTEMRVLSHVAGYTLDGRRNADILQKLNIMSIVDRIAQYPLD